MSTFRSLVMCLICSYLSFPVCVVLCWAGLVSVVIEVSRLLGVTIVTCNVLV